ncbi:hypothetical protein [Streptomyces triticiradicis]|uniref:hypothetical protein n=1 Tax=Streptomyces triticiradicis TaxID=2651189 RepID=UPI001788CFE6|nr:hypothetical protein [Streptomyces triticiradicis]
MSARGGEEVPTAQADDEAAALREAWLKEHGQEAEVRPIHEDGFYDKTGPQA